MEHMDCVCCYAECILSAFGNLDHMHHKALLLLLKEHSLSGKEHNTVEVTCIWLGMIGCKLVYSSE